MSIQDQATTSAPATCCAPLVTEVVDPREAHELSRLFKALADPVRLQLLSMIGARDTGEACVCDLNDAFALSQPTISHHLKVLRKTGLITSERRGTWVYYRLVPDAVDRLGSLLVGPRPASQPKRPEM
jgi:ArsR family transcriptional regulator, arsenate/arsenite/antimonite-responsive transcriptional repressor